MHATPLLAIDGEVQGGSRPLLALPALVEIDRSRQLAHEVVDVRVDHVGVQVGEPLQRCGLDQLNGVGFLHLHGLTLPATYLWPKRYGRPVVRSTSPVMAPFGSP